MQNQNYYSQRRNERQVPGNRESGNRAGTRELAEERTKEENGGRAVIGERSFGQFLRTITLPRNIDPDKITSKYEDGVLEITIPKIEEEEPEQKKIIIETK